MKLDRSASRYVDRLSPPAHLVSQTGVDGATVQACAMDSALAYVGTVEAGGPNRGRAWTASCGARGLGPGQPWWTALVSYVLDAAGVRVPLSGRGRVIRSGLTAPLITAWSIRASEALQGVKTVPAGAVVVWRRGHGPFGHAGLVVRWDGTAGETVKGNTSAGAAGSQADGERVWRRQRVIQPGSYLRIVSFTPVDTEHWR